MKRTMIATAALALLLAAPQALAKDHKGHGGKKMMQEQHQEMEQNAEKHMDKAKEEHMEKGHEHAKEHMTKGQETSAEHMNEKAMDATDKGEAKNEKSKKWWKFWGEE